jgi:hypothetical protein
MDNRTMAGFRKKINEDTTFVHDREDRQRMPLKKFSYFAAAGIVANWKKWTRQKSGERQATQANKRQAPGFRIQAASVKRQASSAKLI